MYILLNEEHAKAKRMPSAILRQRIFISLKAIEAQGEDQAVGEQVQMQAIKTKLLCTGLKKLRLAN